MMQKKGKLGMGTPSQHGVSPGVLSSHAQKEKEQEREISRAAQIRVPGDQNVDHPMSSET
jgi:hypothetical protein